MNSTLLAIMVSSNHNFIISLNARLSTYGLIYLLKISSNLNVYSVTNIYTNVCIYARAFLLLYLIWLKMNSSSFSFERMASSCYNEILVTHLSFIYNLHFKPFENNKQQLSYNLENYFLLIIIHVLFILMKINSDLEVQHQKKGNKHKLQYKFK